MKITSEADVTAILKKGTWQYFEKLVAYIFEEHGYIAESEMLLLRKTKRQFDVIARDTQKTYLVECKKWKNLGNIRNVVKQHLERCKKYYKQYPEESIQPLVVVPYRATVEFHKNVPIVPILSLNEFLSNRNI